MKPSCCNKRLLLLWLALLLPITATAKSALVYYGDDLSWNMAGVHDYIIIQPDHIATDTHGFRTYADRVYAYVSLGEAEPSREYFKRLDPDWLFEENKAWQSRITDLSDPDYRRFMLEEVIAPLHAQGFRNFFFDTLDSYRKLDRKLWEAQEAGLVELIRAVHRRFPEGRLVLNRGFGIIDTVADAVTAILFESYYRGLDDRLEYAPLNEADRQWLDAMLAPARVHGLDIIAVDYLADLHGDEAHQDVKALEAKGFIPYIADKHLMRYGLSSREAVRREILALYDGDLYPAHFQGVHQFGSMPLEYLGYVPVLKDFRHYALPEHPEERFAGVLLWMESDYPRPAALFDWVTRNAEHGLFTLFFRGFGTDELAQYLPLLQIAVKPGSTAYSVPRTIETRAPMIGLEAPVRIMPHPWLLQPRDATPLLRYREEGVDSDLAAITPWGGYALGESSMIEFGPDNLWVADPFRLFVRALRLPPLP
ncbi:MAG: endo alpha-1,4 polygalactosaminidase, partial [Campylobacterales bacterium]|nr:endo alpha-1,4 polygalactosaminidase [Campylobacterales bacterium]